MIVFHHRRAFWLGIGALSLGVVLHLPMYVSARHAGYHMAGMPMDRSMLSGMVLIVVGVALSAYGLVPRGRGSDRDRLARVRVRALDEAPIRRRACAGRGEVEQGRHEP